MMNPEAEFVPRNAQPDPGSGSTVGDTPDSSSDTTPSHGPGDTADTGSCPDDNGVHDTNGHGSGHGSGNVTDPAADPPAGYSRDATSEADDDPSVAPPTGPEYGPATDYYDSLAGPPAGSVYDPRYDHAPGYYPNHDPEFDPRYAQGHPMNQPQPMYHHYNSYPTHAYPEYPAHPEYPTYHVYTTYHPPYPAYPPHSCHPHHISGYATPAYTPSQPVFAVAAPAPLATPPHCRAYVHGSKAGDTYNPSPPHILPATNTMPGRMGDPEAKIFVGDLPIGETPHLRTTHYLTTCLNELFQPFGKCWVNVSWGETAKKGNRVPTGWVQYKKVADAEKALARAKERGIKVGDRRLRIERADGKRILRVWPKSMSSSITVNELHKEFHRFMHWLTSKTNHEFLFHVSDCGELITKDNGPVMSVGVMFRWCEDAQYAARKFQVFPSHFHMRIEPVRTITGLPSWRTSKLDCASRIDQLEVDPGHEWHDNMHNLYLETIDHIEAELEESLDESSSSNNSSNSTPQPSDDRPRQPTSNNPPPSGPKSPSTLEDIEYEREKKVRKAKHWSNVVLRNGNGLFKTKEQAEAPSSSSVQQDARLHMVLDTIEEEGEEEDTENHFHLNSAVENEEEEWEDDCDTVVALSDSGPSEAREETREEIKQGKMPAR
ncbi:hypothetical protein PISL3812_00327 [Talaromyces islandicus]|uniref:RRM domain-containing protein n=1 Tax=Talaromyces islandicus TaxID=28573 RepID=A0A0U1LIZ5_TALIS|nr:hypothetical protein PISL3812_00327 [Talaromyces islandicus]